MEAFGPSKRVEVLSEGVPSSVNWEADPYSLTFDIGKMVFTTGTVENEGENGYSGVHHPMIACALL